MHDLVLRGGLVADGSGAPPVRGDVAVEDGRIVRMGRAVGRARRTVDVSANLITPGFVDIHTHSDFTLPVRPDAAAKLLQGVTTDCTGNCGFSPFPFAPTGTSGERHGVFFEPDLLERWPSLSAYATDMGERRPGINIAPLVGLGAIRLAVMGEDRRAPSGDELLRMEHLLTESLIAGAFGASSGLTYAPGGFADLKELAALGSIVAERGRLYATHIRDEGMRLEESVEEALETARLSQARVQISHLKAFGAANWGKVPDTLRRIDEANAAGLDVAFDAYPYTTACTTLASALPPRALDGGEESLKARVADPAARAELRDMLRHGEKPLDTIILCDVASRPDVAGARLVDLADSLGIAPEDLLLDLVGQDGLQPTMLIDAMSEGDVRAALSHHRGMFGSDGWTMSTDALSYAHPRNFAAAVRTISRYVRDEPLLALGAAVHKLTELPARRVGVLDRGRLAPGQAADLCVLDLEQLDDVASVTNPCRHPAGVLFVLVNGVVAVDEGELTGARGGRVLLAG